jgi:uncharacterized protein YcbX
MKVAAIWRYPVKSLQGEPLARAEVGRHGIAGDRGWAIVDDATGFTLTARREPRLLFARASVDESGLRITLDDGTTPHTDDDLSDWLGRRVRLERPGNAADCSRRPPMPRTKAASGCSGGAPAAPSTTRRERRSRSCRRRHWATGMRDGSVRT